MRFTYTLLITLYTTCLLSGCARIFMRSSPKTDLVYDEKLSASDRIKIRHHVYRENIFFNTTLYESGKVVSSLQLLYVSRRYIITRNENAINYHLVSDTAHQQLSCLEYQFLPRYHTEETLRTFTPITEKDRAQLQALQKVISEGNYKLIFTAEDLDRMKGWVRLND